VARRVLACALDVRPPSPCLPPAAAALPLQLSSNVSLAGGLGDPVAALVLCTPGAVDLSVVNGEVVVSGGQLQTCDLQVGCPGGSRSAPASRRFLRRQLRPLSGANQGGGGCCGAGAGHLV
jgi:hypothetical protein